MNLEAERAFLRRLADRTRVRRIIRESQREPEVKRDGEMAWIETTEYPHEPPATE